MNHEELLATARKIYAQPARTTAASMPEPFSPSLEAVLSPGEFVDRLRDAAFRRSPKLLHPFARRLVRGEWTQPQIQEWVRQDYQRTVQAIRRHTLVAANSADYETFWGLLTRVTAEADADPVGGTFFALPQLWAKFGIALGLTREDIVNCQPHPLLGLLNESLLAEVRFDRYLPVRELVEAMLDPVFYHLWGEALEKSFQLPHDALDFFWAITADRWGEETGRAILQRLAGSREAQAGLWDKYRAEVEDDREWHRFTILQRILESGQA